MGLIKAAVGAVGSTLHDQWKEAIRCEDMGKDVLMVKKTSPNGVISNGSTIIVAPGQCAIIYDNGRIVDATAEDGIFTFDSSSTPSLFAGDFGGLFKEMWQRFTYNGASAKEQAVFYFNLKEITDNKFGTDTPVMYKDWGHPMLNARTNTHMAMSVRVRCHGTYSFKIANPFLFMQEIAGTADRYTRSEIEPQIHSEIIASLANVLNGLGSDKYKIEVLELQNKTDEIKKIMDENVFDEPIRNRGLQLVSFAFTSVSLDDESQTKMDNYEIGGDQFQQQGVLTGAYAEAVQGAANNAGGSANGFMGIGMMNMTSGNAFGGVVNSDKGLNYMQGAPVQNPEPVVEEVKEESKTEEVVTSNISNGTTCPNCGAQVTGKFCGECGTKIEVQGPKFCTNCGKEVGADAKFCGECGTKVA